MDNYGIKGGQGNGAHDVAGSAKWMLAMIIMAALIVLLASCRHDLPLLR